MPATNLQLRLVTIDLSYSYDLPIQYFDSNRLEDIPQMNGPHSKHDTLRTSATAAANTIQWLAVEFRHGRREVALSGLAILCIVAVQTMSAVELPPPIKTHQPTIEIVLYLVAGALFFFSFVSYYLRSKPKRSPTPASTPSAIKGPMSFGPADGELYLRLQRQTEIERLLGFVLDPQIGLIVVTGESGTGKTSLLRAGLFQALQSVEPNQQIPEYQLIYWEAQSIHPVEKLLSTLNAEFGRTREPLFNDAGALIQIAEFTDRPAIIVLDQFEQLRPNDHQHQPIFDTLKFVGKEAAPPHQITWVCAFRRDYVPEWREFEIDHQIEAKMLPVKLFGKEQAKAALREIANASGIELEEELVDDVVESAAKDGLVSPVDIGIGMLVLQNRATRDNRQKLTLRDYRFAGGAEGLLTEYVSDSVERVGDTDTEAVLKALIYLADLKRNQRISEGRTCRELSVRTGLPERILGGHLDLLASTDLRLLEKFDAQDKVEPRYRLPHERLITSLRRLTGRYLAEVDQAQLAFDNGYHAWEINSKRTRYLLKGADLRNVKENHSSLRFGHNVVAKKKYIDLSIRHHNFVISTLSIVILLFFSIGYFGFDFYYEDKHRSYIEALNLPSDLFNYQLQLKSLEIVRPITKIDWFHQSIEQLTVNSRALTSLNGLPEMGDLQTLDLEGAPITSFEGLPELPRLLTLDLSRAHATSLKGLPDLPNLRDLDLSGAWITSLDGLPALPNLKNLDLSATRITGLAGLPELPILQTLNLRSARITSVEGLPAFPNLQSLDLGGVRATSLDGLPSLPKLQNLNLDGSRITSLVGLPALPNLQNLDLSSTRISSLEGLPALPILQTLDLGSVRLSSLEALPALPNLHTLNLSGSQISSLEGLSALPKLQILTLGATQIRNLNSLPRLPRLEKLAFRGTEITSIEGIPAMPNLRTLDLGSTRISSFQGWPPLHNLKDLNLGRARVTSLDGLPEMPDLVTLNLGIAQIATLEGWPTLSNLQTLQLGIAPITRFEGLSTLPNLQALDLSFGRIVSLEGLPEMPNLQSLDLGRSPLTNLEGLPALRYLLNLDLSGSPITSLSGLPEMPNLQTLDLKGAQITSLEGLPALPNLLTLNLAATRITSLDGLPALPNLTTLDLSGSLIASLDGLPALPNLQTLNIDGTAITSLDDLPALQNLLTLKIDGTAITSLDGFPTLPKLQTLVLGGAQMTNVEGLSGLSTLRQITHNGYALKSLEGIPPTVESIRFLTP